MHTKIKYKKNGNVTLEMPLTKYVALLTDYNNLKSTLSTVSECQDLWVSDLRKLESLQFNMFSTLGFVRGVEYWSDSTLPKEK